MQIKDLIQKKRDGAEHSADELRELLHGYLDDEVRDYQMAAWLMAVFLNGLTERELQEWTQLMWKSGRTFPRTGRQDYWIDKHSTGGVGDKTSLVLVPLVSTVCSRLFGVKSVKIPMVSGRGLGHTGGTLDKLESVSGFRSDLSFEQAMDLLERNGFVMMGQTADMAPADRLIYALRDVTGTVESLPLIVSSIMSKKLSENLDGLVFDVKVGQGAFMKTAEEARRLADVLIQVAQSNSVDAVGVLSRMDEPLGSTVGHQLEVEECADFIEGKYRDPGLLEVIRTLASQMVMLAGRGSVTAAEAECEVDRELGGQMAFELFRTMFEAQGGNWSAFERARKQLRDDLSVYALAAKSSGFVEQISAGAFGRLVNELGGGRKTKDDRIDFQVGVCFQKKVGDAVATGDAIAEVYYRSADQRSVIESGLEKAVVVGSKPVKRSSLVLGICHAKK